MHTLTFCTLLHNYYSLVAYCLTLIIFYYLILYILNLKNLKNSKEQVSVKCIHLGSLKFKIITSTIIEKSLILLIFFLRHKLPNILKFIKLDSKIYYKSRAHLKDFLILTDVESRLFKLDLF